MQNKLILNNKKNSFENHEINDDEVLFPQLGV